MSCNREWNARLIDKPGLVLPHIPEEKGLKCFRVRTGSARRVSGIPVYSKKIRQNTQNSSKYTQNYTQVYFIPEIQRKWYTEYLYLSCNIPYTRFKKPLYTVYPKTLADPVRRSEFLKINSSVYVRALTLTRNEIMYTGDPFVVFFICDFHVPFNTICFPLKILRENYFSFLLGVTIVPWKTENKTYPKFSGETKLHYGNVKVADTVKTELCEPNIRRAPSIIWPDTSLGYQPCNQSCIYLRNVWAEN